MSTRPIVALHRMLGLTRLLGLALLLLAGGEADAQELLTPTQRLEDLAGDWVLLDAEGQPTDLRARYEVVGGGAGVSERMLLGTKQETLTLYHSEEGLVTLTQVSRRGRPDRLVPGAAPDAETLRFEPERSPVSHGRLVAIELTWLAEGRLRVTWTHAVKQEDPTRRSFELLREDSLKALSSQVSKMRVTLETMQAELDRRMKREIEVVAGRTKATRLETRTLPNGPGWNHSGVPFKEFLHNQDIRFASTFASEGDRGMTVAHHPFKVGKACRVRFTVLGGNGYIAITEEKRAPPREIQDIPAFDVRLGEGKFGTIVEKVVGGQWAGDPRAFEWDLSKFAGKTMRIYVVDAVSNHYGQIAVSEIVIAEDAE